MPFWPKITSFPLRPLIVSRPLPPQMMSSPGVPFRVSEAFVPVIPPARAQRSSATPTIVVVDAVLFVELGSAVAEDTVAVFVITVPLGVPGLTSTVMDSSTPPPASPRRRSCLPGSRRSG